MRNTSGHLPFHLPFVLGIVALGAVLLAGCTPNPAPVPVGAPTGPLTIACATKATASAQSWVLNKQIVGSLNGGPAGQISNFVYPLGLQFEDDFAPTAPGFTAWAPDGKHLATLMEVLVPGQMFSYPYIVDTTTKAATAVTLPPGQVMWSPIEMEWARERSLVWADDDDLLILGTSPNLLGGPFASQTTSYRYHLTTHALTALPGVTTAVNGVVRCDTLFYLELDEMKQFQVCEPHPGGVDAYWYVGSAYLRRYRLSTQAPIGQPYLLGSTSSCPDKFDREVDAMGWDVTNVGARLVYQQTADTVGTQVDPQTGFYMVQTSSRFLVVAFTNPTAPTPILAGIKTNANAHLAIAPNQKDIAVVATDSLLIGYPSSPSVYTGAISGGAVSTLGPAAGGLPAWHADSIEFDASNLWGEIPDTQFPALEHYQLGVSTAVGTIPGAHHPASLP